jgi:hypothetical protein
MLKAWGAEAFHATDFYGGAKAFKRDSSARQSRYDEDSRHIPKIIGQNVERIFLVSFRPKEFAQIASPEWKEKFGASVHSHAVQLCLIANGWWRHEKCPTESFSYFMEAGDMDESEVVKTVARMRQNTETAPIIKVNSFTIAEKGADRGNEAADFAAWQWNKYYMDKMRFGRGSNPRKDLAALVAASNEKVEYIFATGAYLKYIFSLVPDEILKG